MKKNTILLIIITILITSCTSFTDQSPDDEKELKVMAWNIWHGGHNESLPRDGRPDVIRVINQSKADVVLMIETYGSAPQIAKATGMKYAIFSKNPENKHENLCIFSRYPILKKEIYPISSFYFIAVIIDVNGTPVRAGNLWIDYRPDATEVPTNLGEATILDWEKSKGDRVSQITKILKILRREIADADQVPLIIGGDFNSHSHLDWIKSTADLAPYGHGGITVDWEVSNKMTCAGFIDSWRAMHPDPSTHYGVTWLSENQPCRIDYIYYKGSKLKAVDCEIVNFPPGENFTFRGAENLMYPSDHGFVLTTFKINTKD